MVSSPAYHERNARRRLPALAHPGAFGMTGARNILNSQETSK
jgi:hypothetical protein